MSLFPDTHPLRPRRPLPAWISTCLACLVLGVPAVAAEGERFDLETSDGVSLAVWHYAPPEDVKPLATVIVVHDLEGSHKMVEPLAVALQSGSCAVWVPDLRGHGASTKQAGRDTELDVRQMRKADYEQMAAGAGGTLRTQAAVRGDLETVYAFLASRDTAAAPVAVIGCGAGATIAALWTAADWTWPPLASGPQGQTVRALVLVSPVWAAKGLTLQPALASDTVKRDVPLMIVSGKGDRDAVRLFEQLKRLRPRGWFDQRAVGQFTKAKEVEKPGDASLFLMELDTTLAGEKLVRDDAARVSDRIKTFLGLVLDQPRER